MEARELKTIGNFYKPTDGSPEPFKSVTVDDLKAWSMGAVYGKAIPLTEEWLVKFGFEDKGGVNGILQKRSSNPRREVGLFDLYEDGRCWSVMFQEDVGCGFSDLNEIEYVHQLQNLYFALTGEELTTPQ